MKFTKLLRLRQSFNQSEGQDNLQENRIDKDIVTQRFCVVLDYDTPGDPGV